MVTASIGISESDVQLVISCLRDGTIEPHTLVNWTMGRALNELPTQVVAPLFDQMLTMDGIAYSVALDLMGMYLLDAHEKIENLRPQLKLRPLISTAGTRSAARRWTLIISRK